MSKYKNLNIGVLALQGDFESHQRRIIAVGADSTLVKLPVDLENIDGIIIPGGESTTMDNLIDRFDLRQPLKQFGRTHPVWGTCAGMIMLAKDIVDNQAKVQPLELMDIDVIRMGYGRQVFSFEDNIMARLDDRNVEMTATFIRAPVISRIGENVQTLAVYHGAPVLVSEGNILASSFHTELDDDTTLLEYFLNKFFQI